MAIVDVVTVAYNSAEHLRGCVEPLSELDWVQVIVVDNASSDAGLATVADLPVLAVASPENLGFAGGCNLGWRAGESPYVLFLNPDAAIDEASLRRLVDVLESRTGAGLAAPQIVGGRGELHYSLRRFPRLRSTYAQAFLLHRLAPRASWSDEIIRDPAAYESSGAQQWVSGACMLVRRSVLDELGGWDDGFFLYCEDIDLCRRIHALGLEVWYEPTARVEHAGGGSAPRASMLPFLAASRLRYARLHRSSLAAAGEQLGLVVEAAGRMLVAKGGRAVRVGHLRSLCVAASGGRISGRPHPSDAPSGKGV